MSVGKMDPNKRRLRFLIYGPSGSGKTFSVRTIPAHLNVKVVDFDDGSMQLEGKDGIKIVQFLDPPPIPESYSGPKPDVFHAWTKGRDTILSTLLKPGDVDILVIDSLTAISESIFRFVGYEKTKDYYRAEIQDWGVIVSELSRLLQMLTRPRIHVIMLAHEQKLFDKKGYICGGQPLIYGKNLPWHLPEFFDEVYYASKKGSRYVWDPKGNSEQIGKSRLGYSEQMPQNFSDPFNKLKNEFNGAVPEKGGASE